jgi:MFS family permease
MSDPARDPYLALRHPAYRRYLPGHFLSNVGRQGLAVAAAWQIYDWTKSATALGLVGLVQVIPIILFSLPGGALADRFDRRNVITRCMSVSTVLSLLLVAVSLWPSLIPDSPLLRLGNELLLDIARIFERQVDATTLNFSHPALPVLYFLLFVHATVRVLANPSRAAIVPQLIPASAVGNAITWNSSLFELSTVVGPGIAGVLVHFWGYTPVYALDAVFSATLAVSVLGVKLEYLTGATRKAGSSMLAGLGFIWRHKPVLAAVLLDLLAVVLGGATVLLPVYADRILHVGSIGLGALRAAPAIGAIIMAMVVVRLPPARRPGLYMLWSVAGFGAAIGLFSLSTSFWLALLALLLSGACDNYSVVVRHSLVQLLTPDELRGRVSAVNQLFIGCSNELSSLRAGLMAALIGPVLAASTGGLGTIAITLVIALAFPVLRTLPPLHTLKPAADDPAGLDD